MLTPRSRPLLAIGAALAIAAVLAGTGDATTSDTAPSNTASPTVTGTAQKGDTLTTNSGSWAGTTPMTFTYAWERCDSSGASCSAIGTQTNQTYTLQSGDVGHTVRSSVTATNSAGSATQLSNATDVVSDTSAPANTSEPKISGSATVGSQLTVSNGAWSGSTPITYSYQWRRCDTNAHNCSDINGATSQNYSVATDDVGHTIRAIVTATNSAGHNSATANASAVVGGVGPALVSAPVVTGIATEGQTLSTTTGSWSGATPITYTYQWYRCDGNGNNCNAISGATGSKYVLVSADVGRRIRAKITATNSTGSNGDSSNAVGPVTAGGAGCVLPAANVSSADRLTVASVKYSPSLSHGREPVSATYKVIDQNQCAVSDALVYVVGLPYNWMLKVPEARTGANGQVTLTLTPTRAAPLRGALVMFVRARTPQGNLLAGSSTRRLVQLLLRP
ncbi:MAG TPA: hypothetical protein VGH52_05165 [Gaiellaceae bacterium]